MALEFASNSILEQKNIQDVEYLLGTYALELALLGEIPRARELVSLLYQNGKPVRPSPFERAIIFAWSLTNEYPMTGEDIDEAKLENERQGQRKLYKSLWGRVPEELRRYDPEGLDACLDEKTDGRTPRTPGGEIPYGSDATTGWHAMLKGQRVTKALDISMQLHRPSMLHDKTNERLVVGDLDDTSASLVRTIAGRWRANQAKVYLAQAENLWPAYARGLLADAIGLGEADVSERGKEILDVFRRRLQSGWAESSMSTKTIKELLDAGNHFTIQFQKNNGDTGESQAQPGSLFQTPASEAQIVELEHRLGVKLPTDYKEFLAASNGFGKSGAGIFNGYFLSSELYESSRVEWIEKSYFELPVDLLGIGYIDLRFNLKHQQATDQVWDTSLPLFDRVLQIGSQDRDHVWLVQPELVAKARESYEELRNLADEGYKKAIDRAVESFAGSWEKFRELEWCCATWAAGGSAHFVAFRSFRDYLEDIVGVVIFTAVSGCLSSNAIAYSHWTGPALWYGSIVLAVAAIFTGAQQTLVVPEPEVFDDLPISAGRMGLMRLSFAVSGERPNEVSNYAVFAWPVPIMLLSFSIFTFLAGLCSVVYRPLAQNPHWDSEAKTALVFAIALIVALLSWIFPTGRIYRFDSPVQTRATEESSQTTKPIASRAEETEAHNSGSFSHATHDEASEQV